MKRVARLSVALRAATIVVFLAAAASILACGGGGKDGGPPARRTPQAEPGVLRTGTLDLSGDSDAVAASAVDAGDLLDGFGSIASGDVNGDGLADLLVGAGLADGPGNKRADAGEAYVVLGGDGVPALTRMAEGEHDMTVYGAKEADQLGSSVLAADLNGDGVDDVIVAAPGVTAGDDPRTDQGRAYVFFGSDSLPAVVDLADDGFDFTVTGAEGFSRLGHTMASGDLNGDGRADLILGAPFAGREPGSEPGSPRLEHGEVYVVFGSRSLSGELNIAFDEPDFWVSAQQHFGQFGVSVAAGDVNGDGTEDLVVGAPQTDLPDGGAAGGAVYVFFGGAGLGGRVFIADQAQDAWLFGAEAGDGLGFPLAVADVNGDGSGDIIAGARTADGQGNRQTSAGEIGIWTGGEGFSGQAGPAGSTIFGLGRGDAFPAALLAFDATGDGAAEIVASSMGAPGDRLGAGTVYVLPGGSDLPLALDAARGLWVVGAAADDRLGGAISSLNGALVAQASGADGDQPDLGSFYLIEIAER
jgi:hypothetical protein